MKVLVACEFTGLTRDAFTEMGHKAMSCDFLDSERPGGHYKGYVGEVLDYPWDLMIAHPPCNHLSVSGRQTHKEKIADGRQQVAASFFMTLAKADIPRICVENPISVMSTIWREPDQIVQPWMFGHGETKATCFWLKGLPKLRPTNVVTGRDDRIRRMPPSPDRAKERSRTYPGMAKAFASQWGYLDQR